MVLTGIFPALTTPFYPDGRLYPKKLEHNVDRYSRTPVSGMTILGSTGEVVMLSESEQREVLRVAVEAAAPEKVLMAGVGHESALKTVEAAEYAAKLNYDLALVRTPHYYRPQMKPENLLAYYRFVADRSPLPVMLYSVPPFTAYDLPAETIQELADHPNIVGIKESSGVIEKIADVVARTRHVKRTANATEVFNAVTARMLLRAGEPTRELVSVAALSGSGTQTSTSVAAPPPPAVKLMRKKEVGFQLLAGSAQKLLQSLEAGAVGAVLAFGAAAPTACFEVYTAWKDGDKELAKLKQQRIVEPATRVASQLGIPALKYALDLNGYYGGPPRLPLLPLTADQRAEVERLMADVRN
ncbi:MAG TPA: dihydrodipicolinate synthase family protein [Terriglobales bacterium]|jgi:dihydrodipicolinate synthase/N-acetylneuraminate lyase|nr:dihydrodipicolinate synthase family protein [Terriglobales bacterium]